MSDFENMDDWTEDQVAAYFGSADDPIESEPVVESSEYEDLWVGYDPSTAGSDDNGAIA
jgi:hypothetical protein